MDARSFKLALDAHGIDRGVGDAIIDYVDEQKSNLVTNQKLELEMSKLRGDLRGEMSDLRGELKREMSELRGDVRVDMVTLRAEFAEHKTHMTRLVLGSSSVIGLLIVAMRLLPVAG
ncbi:MAG: hypothetical protein AAF317_21130 [Pseudomonadota bacterium]